MGPGDRFSDGGQGLKGPALIEDAVGADIDDVGFSLPLTDQSRSRERS